MRQTIGYRNRHRHQRGAAMITTMMMITVLAVIAVSYMSLSANSSRIANRACMKVQATALAEAGVHAMFAQVTQTLRSGSATMPTIQSTTLTSTNSGVTTTDGTYSAVVLSNPYVRSAVVDGNGNTTGYIDTYTITAQGTGTSADGGTQAKVHATFTVSQRETEAAGSGSAFTFPNAAVVSNGNILLQGSASTKSLVTLHGAGVEGNGVISNNGNAYSVDGPIAAAPASYSATEAALGNSPNCYQNTVSQLGSPISFPDAATIATWKSTWANDSAEDTTTYPSGHITNSAYTASGNVTMTAPWVINGDLNLSHNCNLTLNQDPNGTAPYVLYVHGNLTFASGGCSLTNNGVLIVCDGVVTIGKNSTYTCSNLTSGGLVSLNTSSNAISLTAGSNEQVGLCYAVNGGVLVSGNATVTGSVISGQTGATGGISLQGTPTIDYPGSLNSNFTGLPPSDNLTVSQQYTPTSPMNWVQTL